MNITQFDLNDKVKVKLTEAGQEYLKRNNYQLETDSEGYLILSLWRFAGIFGNALQFPTLNPPIEPDIIYLLTSLDLLTGIKTM